MKTVVRLCARYARVTLYGAWFFALIRLLPDGQFETFLRPEFGALLGIGVLLIIAFLLLEMGRMGHSAKPGFAGAMRWLALIAPLAYLPITRGVALDGTAFDNRWTGFGGSQQARPFPLVEQAAQAVTDGVQSVTLSDLCWDAERYHGRLIVVDGMIKRSPGITADFGADACLLYRYVINCCVADAMPAAILIVGELPDNCLDDNWIRAEGTFRLETGGSRDIIRLDLDSATKIPRPKNPYLY